MRAVDSDIESDIDLAQRNSALELDHIKPKKTLFAAIDADPNVVPPLLRLFLRNVPFVFCGECNPKKGAKEPDISQAWKLFFATHFAALSADLRFVECEMLFDSLLNVRVLSKRAS